MPRYVFDAISKSEFLVNPKYEINYRLLYHIIKQYEKELMSSQVGAGIPSVSSNKLSSLKIPVPPIEVQLEIVRILDNFTELTSELIAKLSEECAKIKKQYEYLKDKCLDFNGKITTKRFGELAHIVRGASPRPIHTFITEKSDGINWIKIGDVKAGNKYITETKEKINKIGASKSRIVKDGDFLLSNSMSFGRPYISAIALFTIQFWNFLYSSGLMSICFLFLRLSLTHTNQIFKLDS